MLGPVSKQFVGTATSLLPLFDDDEITDIFINGTQTLYVEKGSRLEQGENPFKETHALQDFIERLLVPLGKRVDAQRPYIDGRLLDGSRFHVILPPLSTSGPMISIRKLRKKRPVQVKEFTSPETFQWVEAQMAEKKNLLICGSTGSGKTTLLRGLIEMVPHSERVLIIEETQELRPDHPHVLSTSGGK